MELYATTTSERATKGQGGNEFIAINLYNDKKICFGSIEILPDESVWVRCHGEKHFIVNQKQLNQFDTKDKKQKTVKTICRHCGKIHKNDTAIC